MHRFSSFWTFWKLHDLWHNSNSQGDKFWNFHLMVFKNNLDLAILVVSLLLPMMMQLQLVSIDEWLNKLVLNGFLLYAYIYHTYSYGKWSTSKCWQDVFWWFMKILLMVFLNTVKSWIESGLLLRIWNFCRDSNRVRTVFESGLYLFFLLFGDFLKLKISKLVS